MKKYHLYRQLGTLLSVTLVAGCVQAPVATGRSSDAMSGEEKSPIIAIEQPPVDISRPAFEGTVERRPSGDAPPLSGKPMHASHFWQSGFASWYGNAFQGRRTASGERYDMHALTAAHRTLPLGSYVRVTTLTNARSVVVRINDRGPYIRGRVIDLSFAAAAALGLPGLGTARVSIERIAKQEGQQAVLHCVCGYAGAGS